MTPKHRVTGLPASKPKTSMAWAFTSPKRLRPRRRDKPRHHKRFKLKSSNPGADELTP